VFIGEQFWFGGALRVFDERGCNPQQLGYDVQRRFSPWMLSDVDRLVPAKRPCNETLRDEQINRPSLFALMRAGSAKSQRRVKSGMSSVGQPDRASRSPALDVTSLGKNKNLRATLKKRLFDARPVPWRSLGSLEEEVQARLATWAAISESRLRR
jgi:hypothetical protein